MSFTEAVTTEKTSGTPDAGVLRGRPGRVHPTAHLRRGQSTLPIGVVPAPAPMALSLLRQARQDLAEAEHATDIVVRFTAAYLSALRAAAGMLAARGRPHRGRAKPASAWLLLESATPELVEWARFFASRSAIQAAAQAGVTRRVTEAGADELLRRAREFVNLAARAVHNRQEPGTARRQEQATVVGTRGTAGTRSRACRARR